MESWFLRILFAIDEKRKERRGIVQKRAFMSGRCGDDRVSTMLSEEGMEKRERLFWFDLAN